MTEHSIKTLNQSRPRKEFQTRRQEFKASLGYIKWSSRLASWAIQTKLKGGGAVTE